MLSSEHGSLCLREILDFYTLPITARQVAAYLLRVILVGATFGIIFDFTNNVFDITYNGTTWQGGYVPSTGSGGFSLASLISNYGAQYPYLGLIQPTDSATVNFGTTSFAYSVAGSNGILPWKNVFTIGGGGAVTIRRSGFSQTGSQAEYPPCIDANNSWNNDIAFATSSGTTFIDAWSISKDTATITSRVTGTNIGISVASNKPFVGFNDLEAVKAGNNTTAAAFGLLLECDPLDTVGLNIAYAASANSLGTVAFTASFVNLNYYGSGGVPVFGQTKTPISQTLTPTTSYQTFNNTPNNSVAPSWATHVFIQFDMHSMNAGTFYVGLCEVYRI